VTLLTSWKDKELIQTTIFNRHFYFSEH